MRGREQFLFKPWKREAKGRRSSYLGQGQSGEQSSLPTDSETYSWSWRSANPTKQFYGERRLLLNLVNESNNGFTMIGIVGLAGVGKTTLCQETFNNQYVKKHFLPRIWVCMAKQPNETDHEKEVVKRILMGLGFEDKIIEKIYKEGGGLCRLLFALRQELKGKKYLIVLDDVSSLNEGFEEFCSLPNTQDVRKFDRLANGLPTGDGGTVIVSSRCQEMAKKMVGEKNLHCLLPLADKGRSWNIFKDEVAKDGLTPPQYMEEPLPQDKEKMKDIEKMKDMIADRCGGLPFFAKMLGQCVHQNLQKEKKETPEKQSPKTQQKEKQETLQKESQETQKKEKHETQQEQKHETQQKGSQETQQKEKQETPQENKHEIQQKVSQETQQEQKHETQQKGSQEAQQKEKQETSQENKHEIQQKESQETQQKEKQETPQENKHEIQQKESQETQQKESPGTQHKESKETQQKEKHETQQKESQETLKKEEIEKHKT